jgi:hypothetical protein
MGNGVITDNTISHNTASKLLFNVNLNNSTTWNNNPNRVPFSSKCLCVMQVSVKLWTLKINDTINGKCTLVKHFSLMPLNKSLKISYQNIRGLGNKPNELFFHLCQGLPHILCSLEHHLSRSELQLIHLNNY